MKNLLVTFLALIIVQVAVGQKKQKEAAVPTSKVVESLSYYWRLDSMANNGFRLHTVDLLFKSKLDNVSKQFLLANFGKPNEVIDTNSGLQFIYYYVDPSAMPNNHNVPPTRESIMFLFPSKGELAVGVFQSDTGK